ncbi:MAG TPA: flavoprotein [Pirellulales bacterium]|jgi:phosphopantothenoylcysteine decarboxylase/phosphopantothenate--cysteine ligase|nr:flavoprotein [Pirellulales bacterium]
MQGREIIVGVSGGVAAYKTAALVSRLVQAGAGVTVVMTAGAREFIGPATFSALSGRPIAEHSFDCQEHPLGAHIDLARRAQLLCVAPATANLLAKAATGLADDLLSTLLLSFTGPVLLAPAMNSEMWEKLPVQRNVQQLREDGFHLVGPEEGWLSCRQQGPGRMAEPEKIFAAITALLQ